ncbi:MAG: 2-polyprenyl-3-methyl-6-methoxy-1,4-benzoquinone monooxygenase [Gammaproteobacteria bacterium]|nr:2-polyprenyl-3-methyl-6-methoxy-1,4-benzoquinone monooxygenase [Gammaproteobacteria bacterium]MCG3143582.1 2-nonaprenyl-3-methyl-6-methoxy-1,4-benzoquinol hydroxylase [Gammaproteobacteria bacterium]
MNTYDDPREYSTLDRLLMAIDDGVRTVFGRPPSTGRTAPDTGIAETPLSAADRRVSEGLMRVNHTGEICAQALYSAQALTARNPEVRRRMQRAAAEENDHLIWCESRVHELGGHLSYLNPLWYAGSFAIGALAGLAGDRWNLGFVVETERQVEGHLEGHLQRLPEEDAKSRAIVAQMRIDEGNHAEMAQRAGAVDLPGPLKRLMKLQSRVMTTAAYWI